MRITVVLDVSCPWCLVGMRQLDRAIAERPDFVSSVDFLPYFINPTMPVEGRDRDEHYRLKFGDYTRYERMRDKLEEEGRNLGINFNLRGKCIVANTLDAHRLILWAGGQEESQPGIQRKMAYALMNAYFEDRRNVGDKTVLQDIAVQVGLDGGIVADLLESDRDKAAIVNQVIELNRMGVQGVPFYIFGDKGSLSGAQDASVFISVFDKLSAGKE